MLLWHLYINSGKSAGLSLAFPENYTTDFSQTSPFSSLYCSLGLYVHKPNVLLRLFSYNMRILVKIRLFWLCFGLFWYIFLPSSPEATTESSPPSVGHIVAHIVVGRFLYAIWTISTVGHGICLFSREISSTDYLHFHCFKPQQTYRRTMCFLTHAHRAMNVYVGRCYVPL